MTSLYGAATVLQLTPNGAIVCLDALPGTRISLQQSEIVEQAHQAAHSTGAKSATPTQTGAPRLASISDAQFLARKSVEALRFGIVPVGSIREVTIGFAELQDWVVAHLPHNRDGRSHISEVSGAFGSGKSHTMAAIRSIAEEHAYVTAHVEVNGDSVSLSDPEGVLRQLWPTLSASTLESATPVLDVNLEAIENGITQTRAELAQYDRVAANIRMIARLRQLNCLEQFGDELDDFLSCGDALTASQLQRLLYNAISQKDVDWRADPVWIKRLIGLKLQDRPSDFVRCILAYAIVARRAGYKGLVLTIDEFEVEYHLSQAKFDRLLQTLEALELDLGGEPVPLTVFIATVGSDGRDDDSVVGALVDATGGSKYHLKPWSARDVMELAGRIHRIYCEAYELSASFEPAMAHAAYRALDSDDRESSGLVRSFIKQYVASLDVTHGPCCQ